jgi:hypothetical protein
VLRHGLPVPKICDIDNALIFGADLLSGDSRLLLVIGSYTINIRSIAETPEGKYTHKSDELFNGLVKLVVGE